MTEEEIRIAFHAREHDILHAIMEIELLPEEDFRTWLCIAPMSDAPHPNRH